MTVQELALKTLAEIDRRGWIKEDFFDPDISYEDPNRAALLKDCKVCLAGAVRAADTGSPEGGITTDGGRLYWALADRIRPGWSSEVKWPAPGNVIFSWNDDPATTVEDVRALLLQVAAS